MKKKKILFEVLHPAHVHLFKNLIFYLNSKEIDCMVVSREKDITNELLKHYNIPFVNLSKAKTGIAGLITEALIRDFRTLKLQLKHRFDIAFTTGTSFSAAHISVFTKLKTYNFIEDDDEVVKLYSKFTYPFTDYIVVPDCLKYKRFRKKRILYPSYHELAYLHPNNFNPDINIVKSYNLKPKKYVIIRLSALKAHHDIGMKGISLPLLNKIKKELKDYTIIESSELNKHYHVKPWDMHHVLAFAKMIVCDSQTMAAESMVLGVPSIRINSFVGKISYLDELENKYNLGFGYIPDKEDKITDTVKHLATDKNIEPVWQEKRKKMLNEKIDLNEWMIELFEKI